MERKGRIRCLFLTALLFVTNCSYHDKVLEKEMKITFSCGLAPTRSADPDEEKISDISLMIFDRTGAAEECVWLNGEDRECSVRLVAGEKYIFCACANFGYQVYADHIEELGEIKYHLAYPDEYSQGIPMYAYQEFVIEEGMEEITVTLKRLMAKISLQMDRRRLSEDVDMYVRTVRIGNCPRTAKVFIHNAVSDADECFPTGFTKSGAEADNLNQASADGLSRSVSLYMLENMQGDMEPRIGKDEDKVFGKDDHRRNVCSYIEMELEYMSKKYYSGPKGLIYRFYLGEGRNDLNVERNCHYRITVAPEDDGLGDDGWRVDKSDLTEHGPAGLKAHPSEYINGNIGDRIHIWCEVSPSYAEFDVGESYMEFDHERGIYDYEIDEDGHGATLTLTGPGSGLIYMEAGAPINDAALFIIEVNLPK